MSFGHVNCISRSSGWDKEIPYGFSLIEYNNLSWMWDADRKIRPRFTVWPNNDPEGRIFLSASNNHDRFFFLHTLWSPAFDFNVGVKLTSHIPVETWRRMWHCNDVIAQRLSDKVTWRNIQTVSWQHALLFVFSSPEPDTFLPESTG